MTHRVSLVLTAGTRTALTLAGVEVVPEVPVGDLDLEALQVRASCFLWTHCRVQPLKLPLTHTPLLAVQEGGVSGVARVVRELRARIVASHQRAELLTQAAAAYLGMQWSNHEPAVAVPLNGVPPCEHWKFAPAGACVTHTHSLSWCVCRATQRERWRCSTCRSSGRGAART